MDDRRIENALREGPPDEPAYAPGLGPLQATDQPAEDAAFEGRIRRAGGSVRARPQTSSGLRFAASLAAVLAIVVAGFAIRFSGETGASPTPGDLLARIRAAGLIRIAVSTESPQTAVAGSSYIGFDVDVANAIARELGVGAEIFFLSPAAIARDGRWDLALPSHVVDEPGPFVVGGTYYRWSDWLVVADESVVAAINDLDGATICAVDGSPAVNWLSGRRGANAEFLLTVPDNPTIVRRTTDADCFDAIANGEAEAAVTATILEIELGGRGLRALGGRAAIVEPRNVLIRIGASEADSASAVTAVEAAIAKLKASGELAELSRRAFGGVELTEAIP